eukprot:scaffold13210_cov71-Skeletonema_dohrnii-CCMP3373.AAC.1
MGYRCSLIPLPPTPNDQTNDPEPNANLNDSFLWDNLLHNDIPIFPSTSLTIEPTHIDSITPPIHLLPVTFLTHLPLYHYLTLTFMALLSKILQRKILFRRTWPRHQSHPINSSVQPPRTTNFMEPSFPMSSTSTTRHHYSSLYDKTLPKVSYDSDTIYHNPWLTTAHNSPVHDQLYPPTNPTHISHPTLSHLHQLTPMSFPTQDLMTSSLSSYRRFSSTLSPDHFLHTSSPKQPTPSASNTPQHHFSTSLTDVNSNNSTTSPPTTMTHLHDCPLDDGEPVSPSFHPAELASPPNSDEISEGDINKSNTQPTTNVSPPTNTAHTGSTTTVDAVAQPTAPQPSATPAALDTRAFLHDFFTSDTFKTTITTIIGDQVKQHLAKEAPVTPATTTTSTTTGNSTFTSQRSKPSFAS